MGFDIKFRQMDDTPLSKRPWFYIASWLAFLLVVYGWQIYRMGGVEASFFDILVDGVLFILLLILWMAFFAQFVLPVRNILDRQRIFERLIAYLFGGHGPALFIHNGEVIKREGEERKQGPGVLWLDTASAAVTRTATAIKQTMGPGVHFLSTFEYVAGTLDLHIQSQSIGPRESDKPFAPRSDSQTEDEYKQVQERCKQVSALTRDGIEVVPRISISFRVNTGFPKPGQLGSRFGYRKGVTKKDREREEQDKEAIRRAILGEGINPNESPDSHRHRVAWNQLPVLLAVDIWREYAGKFTLDQLFDPSQLVPTAPPQVPQPTEDEIGLLSQPVRVGARRENVQSMFASMLHEINAWMARTLEGMEGIKEEPDTPSVPASVPVPAAPKSEKSEPQKKTALQVINELVKARLTEPEVVYMDDNGVRGDGMIPSKEYKLLQDRGLKVLSVSIGGLMMNPEIEDTIIKRWSTTWLKNATTESEQIERRKNILEAAAREKAIRQHAHSLSREIVQKKPVGVKDTLRTLLMHTRSMIFTNDQLRRRMINEQQELEEIIKWIETNES